MFKDQQQLMQALAAQNAVPAAVLEQVKQKAIQSKVTPEEILLKDKILDEEKLVVAKAALLNIPAADLRGKEIDQAVLKLIPSEVAEHYKMVAFGRANGELEVGLVDPQDFKAIEAVEFLGQKTHLKVKYAAISPASFTEVAHQYKVIGEEMTQALAGIQGGVFTDSLATATTEQMQEVVKSAPVSKMVLVIIRHALDGRASDIHIEPLGTETKVRYRIDGVLRTSLVLPKYIHSAIIARIKVLSNLRLDETRKPQDGRIRLTIDGREVDFRVSTLPLVEGEKVVLRILDSSSQIPTLESLGFNAIHIAMVKEAIKKPHGLLLLTGPTGSGKTTTLYTVLKLLNQDGINIITLEDPIEYYIGGINQSQINPEIGYTFASGLRSILRQDPNVIMLGEIRDEETTQLVVQASLTGHTVLSTLHTNSAAGAIPRLIDLGAEPFLLSSVLNMTIAQRLARKICPDCKEETTIPEPMLKKVKDQLTAIPDNYFEDLKRDGPLKFWKGKGCARCGDLGYRGRVAVAEIILTTNPLSEIINRGGHRQEIEQELTKQNFITLTQDCLLKALRGITTLDEVVRVSQL